jgi:hypothetical protein
VKIQTKNLTSGALDWAVAKCEDYFATLKEDDVVYTHPSGEWHHNGNWSPSTKWAQGGPIIEREQIDCINDPNGTKVWLGRNWINFKEFRCFGPTPLIAAMRCYVASKLGDEVEIPEGLL